MVEGLNFKVDGIMPVQTVSSASTDPVGNDVVKITEEFAKLLIAQVSNQDPDNPVDNTQIVTQYSQMLATLGTIKMQNSYNQFEQVKIGADSVGKTITYKDPISPYKTDADGNQIPNEKVGIVTEVNFETDTPRIKISGVDTYVPIANILKIHN